MKDHENHEQLVHKSEFDPRPVITQTYFHCIITFVWDFMMLKRHFYLENLL